MLCVLAGCEAPTSTEWESSPSYARGSTSGVPTVTSTSPSSAARGTTLDVRVLGSGFDPSSKAQWAINGVPSEKVVVNSTRYVSSGEVVANISIASDADVTLYDVIVSAVGGKPGIGSEMFLVSLEEADLSTAGGPVNGAMAINDQAVIVGISTDRASYRAGTQYPVRWNLVNGKWVMTKLSSVATVRAAANAINEANIIVGMSNLRATVWLPDGKTIDLGSGCAIGINASNLIVGTMVTSTGFKGVVWVPTQGTWVPQELPGAGNNNLYAMYSCEIVQPRAINGAGTVAGEVSGKGAAKWIALGPSGPWSNPILLTKGDGSLAGGEAFGINEAGDIVGTVEPGVTPHLWRATGEQVDYADYGSGSGFALGINDSPQPDVVAKADGGPNPFVFFGGSSSVSPLSRFGGSHKYDGAWDVNNPTATQPMRVVGALSGKPKVWTAR